MLTNEKQPKASDLAICIANLPSVSHVSHKFTLLFVGWDSIAGTFLFNESGFSERVDIARAFEYGFLLSSMASNSLSASKHQSSKRLLHTAEC